MNDTAIFSDLPSQFNAASDIAFTKYGSAVDIRLTRPQALNALTHNMAKALYAGLRLWAGDASISHVVVSADTGEKRAFCAGGDIRDLYDGFKAGTPRNAFFRDEYRLNEAIATFPKPYIALMDGVLMGGGAGISMHGSHRIVTENTRFAMPEVGIGLIPDVGGSYVLPRLKNHFGSMLGLTGTMIGAEECLEAGIATHFCNSSDIELLRKKLLRCQEPELILQNLRGGPNSNALQSHASDIADIFAGETLQDIVQHFALKSQNNPFLSTALKRMMAASPLSLSLAFEQLKRGKYLSLKQCLTMEYQLVSRILNGPDLYEGIRAVIIDRSTPPNWLHASIADVEPKLVASFFSAPPEGDLTFEI